MFGPQRRLHPARRRKHICAAVRSQAGPECLQIELGCRSLLTWQKPSPREGTGCFMGSRSCSTKKKKKSPSETEIGFCMAKFPQGWCKKVRFQHNVAAAKADFLSYFVCRGKPAQIRLCFHSSVLSDIQGHINDKHNTVRAVKFNYFNLWLDDSFLQSQENKPWVMNCCFMWSCG